MASVLILGGDARGLRSAAAARGLRLVAANDPSSPTCRVALRYAGRHQEWPPTACPTLHVVRGGEEAVARALDAGVDDAVDASASDMLIAARLAALARRGAASALLRVGGLTIDRVERCARRDGRVLKLLPREYALLLRLAEQAGEPVPRDVLHAAVCNLRFDPGTNVLAVHVSRLRAKLDRGHAFAMLRTERGRGYQLVAEPPGAG